MSAPVVQLISIIIIGGCINKVPILRRLLNGARGRGGQSGAAKQISKVRDNILISIIRIQSAANDAAGFNNTTRRHCPTNHLLLLLLLLDECVLVAWKLILTTAACCQATNQTTAAAAATCRRDINIDAIACDATNEAHRGATANDLLVLSNHFQSLACQLVSSLCTYSAS